MDVNDMNDMNDARKQQIHDAMQDAMQDAYEKSTTPEERQQIRDTLVEKYPAAAR